MGNHIAHRGLSLSEHTYRVTELVGSSKESIEDAINGAIGRANQTLKGLDWFRVKEISGTVTDGKVGYYQVTIGLGFRVMDAEDLK